MYTGRPNTYEYLCFLTQGAGVSFDRMSWLLPGHQSLMMHHKEMLLFIKTW